MDLKNVNDMLRNMILRLINSGWNKTSIGRILLGTNGQTHMNHWLKLKDNGENNNFGIRPLSKIAKLLDYDLHIVFVDPKKDQEDINRINQLNSNFTNHLEQSCKDVLNNVPVTLNNKNNKNQIDDILDELLN